MPDILLFDRSDRLRMQFTGPKAGESLTGLVTNDVLALRGGDGLYACALTNKGKIIADVRIFATDADNGAVHTYLVDTGAAAGPGFAAMIRKYVNPRTAKYTDLSASTACLSLLGDGVPALLVSLGADATVLDGVAAGAPYANATVMLRDVEVRVARVPDLGDAPLFDLFSSADHGETLRAMLTSSGAVVASAAEWQRRRVLAMRPEWGIDMDENTLAQEANMDALHAISYRKGCYTGQETVARVHFRGHVNKTLRRVQVADAHVLPIGTPLRSADGVEVGAVRSTARDESGVLVGIAMLRRDVLDAQMLTCTDGDGSERVVTVHGNADD